MVEIQAGEAIRYRRAAACGALVPLLVFGVGAAMQSEIFQVARNLAAYGEIYDVPLWARLVANLTAAVLIGAGVWLLPVNPQRRLRWIAAVLGAVAVSVLIRAALQLALGVYTVTLIGFALIDIVVGFFCGFFSLIVGVALAEAFKRVRTQAMSAASEALRASAALDALESEEQRVRRDVAEGLHGTVQQHLVLVSAGLSETISGLRVGAPIGEEDLGRLVDLQRNVDRIREHDVRDMSQLLYPEGIDLGLAQAVRMLVRRIPSSIRVQTRIDEAVVEYDDPGCERVTRAVRLLAVRLLEEALSNALRHGKAGRIDVSLRLDSEHVLNLLVEDDGVGVDPETTFSGLGRLRDRLGRVGGQLTLEPGALTGARLEATIPLAAR